MLLDLIIRNLIQNGDTVAYSSGGASYTFSELCGYIGAIQSKLSGLGDRAPVIVYGNKEVHMRAGIIACLLSGIPYVPVDSSFPKSRVDGIISVAKPSLILGDYESEGVSNFSAEAIESAAADFDEADVKLIPRDKNDTAYIIFTSGSTGTPKGVAVSYKNLESCVRWLDGFVDGANCVLNQAKYSFDLSVADFYISLIKGAEYFALTENEIKDFPLLFKRLGESGADVAVMTPSFADLLLLDKSFNSALMPKISTVIFCGETLKPKTAKKLFERFENIRIINCYGPTEATFAVTSIEITRELAESAVLPVGEPKADVEIIFDDGEIIIVGESVAKGYLPPADSDSFFEIDGKKAYRSGDFGYFENGQLQFKGRRDSQIKLSGYRIEIGDIESNLLEIKGVATAVAFPVYLKNGAVKSVKALVVPERGMKIEAADVISELKKKLPAYMIPKVNVVESIPLNQNGKADLKKLMGE